MVNANLPWVESPFFEEILASKSLSPDEIKLANEYNENGYIVISGLLPLELIDRVRDDVENKGFNPDFKMKRREVGRIQDFWKISAATQELATYPEILKTVEFLYGRTAIPFQTLSFKVGTQQRAHSDTLHFSSLPSKFMCGVWVALEDITEENGPVFYCPGSHHLKEYNFADIRNTAETTSYENYKEYEDFIEKIVVAKKLEKKKFLAKKGDLLIWSSNIIHGGSPVMKEGATRWSQVTHYFFEDCYYYTPMLSNMVTNELSLRRKLTNIKTGERLKPSYNGQKLHVFKTGRKLFTLVGKIKLPILFPSLRKQ